MRISGGIHRSRTLFSPKSNAVRPTSDKTRQAIFNMLHARGLVQDSIVIDAFCGTGALGLETLSQGAAYAVFFDKSKDSMMLAKQNIASLKEENRSLVFLQDVTKLKERPDNIKPATLIFLDPPYHQNLVEGAIQSLAQNNWLGAEAWFVIETAKDEIINCPRINIQNEKTYGDTKIMLASLKL